jgi:hypothetical protein
MSPTEALRTAYYFFGAQAAKRAQELGWSGFTDAVGQKARPAPHTTPPHHGHLRT